MHRPQEVTIPLSNLCNPQGSLITTQGDMFHMSTTRLNSPWYYFISFVNSLKLFVQVRLLALVRKQGMDILFPQYVHDRVLACIFVAIRCHGMKSWSNGVHML